MGKARRQVSEDGESGCREGGEWISPASPPAPPKTLDDGGTRRCCCGRRLSPHLIPPPRRRRPIRCAYDMRVCR